MTLKPPGKNASKQLDSTKARQKYQAPQSEFLEWVYKQGFAKTTLGRIFSYFESKFNFLHFFLAVFFCSIFAFLILFQFNRPIELEVGKISKFDVLSPFTFEMVDSSTTEEKRLKAEAEVPVVFDYDTSIFERVSIGVFKSFRTLRLTLRDIDWKKKNPKDQLAIRNVFEHKLEFEKELGVSIPDYVFEWLLEKRFSAKIETILVRNLEKWYQKKIADTPDRFIPDGQVQILARVVHKNNLGKEFPIQRKEILDLQEPEHFQLDDNKGVENLPEDERNTLLYLARLLVVPNLTLNKQETESRRQSARESILPVKISIKKNQLIIAKGNIVTPFQMSVLNNIQKIKSSRQSYILTSALLLFLISLIVVYLSFFGHFSKNQIRLETKDIFSMMLIACVNVFIIKSFLFIADAAFVKTYSHLFSTNMFLFLAPIASGPMMVALLIPVSEVILGFTLFMSISLGVMEDFNFAFAVVAFISSLAAARGVCICKKRNDVYWAGLRAGIIASFVTLFLFVLNQTSLINNLSELFITSFSAFLSGILSSFVVMIFIPMLESVFNYTTDVKLLELSNLNHPLLKEMIVKAPGTYHHSMMVGSMVEAAAEEIGANPLLAKVMAYYHDIGKTPHANYFIENQKPGHNPHDQISPYMSKTLLVAHIKDGMEMGKNYKLGKPIVDGIVQHHGTTLISYFYNKALDLVSDNGKDVLEGDFRYPGPKPQFPESALIMLADSIEAAARSLDEPTPIRLQNIVHNVIQRKFSDGQLDECNLTLRDLSKIEESFVRILIGIYHQRIDYPRKAGGGLGDREEARP